MRILGVLVNQRASFPPVSQILFCKKLSTWGHRLGMMVIVFTPDGINWTLNKVNGYAYDAFTRQWLMNQYPLPRYIYDRFFCYNLTEYRRYRQLNQVLSRNPQINYLGNSLGNKWYVHQMISKEPSFIRYLPHSEPYLHHKQLQQRLMNREDIFVKPRSGSQGKGVLKIGRSGATVHVVGRDHNNLPIEHNIKNIKNLIERTIIMSMNYNAYSRKTSCDYFIEPLGLARYGVLEIKKAKEIFEAGYQTAIEFIAENPGITELAVQNKKALKA